MYKDSTIKDALTAHLPKMNGKGHGPVMAGKAIKGKKRKAKK